MGQHGHNANCHKENGKANDVFFELLRVKDIFDVFINEEMHDFRIQFIHEEFRVTEFTAGFELTESRRRSAVRTAHRCLRGRNAALFGILHYNGQPALSIAAEDLLLGIADFRGDVLACANDEILKDTVAVG